MKRPVVGLFVVIILALGAMPLVAGAASGTPASAPGASPAASPGATPAASPAASPVAGAEVTVHIKDFYFDPATITVKPGTKVTWINDGPTIHTTTSKDSPPVWDSGIMPVGKSFSHTFTKPGTYDYWCSLHPQMLAEVVVKP